MFTHGGDITFMNYRIIYSSRRTLCAEVKIGGEVIIRAPRGIAKSKIENFIKDHEAWIASATAKQMARANSKYHQVLSANDIIKLKAAAIEYIPYRVKYFSEKMGLIPTAVKISNATKKFGSCSGKNSLNFSYRLMMYPPEAIDYVIVHELAHIKHHNHGKEFYKLIEEFLPDFREREALLKQ